MNPITKILIADDHPVVRQGMMNIIEAKGLSKVVFQCDNGEEVLKNIPVHKPDICILDISMPKLNGLDTIRKWKESNDKVPCLFIIMTMYDNEEYFEEAMSIGVRGYLLKENAITVINDCINTILKGSFYICPQLSDYVMNRKNKQHNLKLENPGLSNLTSTEYIILKEIAQNRTSQEIAEILNISVRTVQNHRNNITSKMGFRGYNKLLQFALDNKTLLD
jgi:DNA-binding NarL/FixJ family response regulator